MTFADAIRILARPRGESAERIAAAADTVTQAVAPLAGVTPAELRGWIESGVYRGNESAESIAQAWHDQARY